MQRHDEAAQRMESVREIYDRFNRRDLSWIDGLPPDWEAHDPPEMPDSQVRRGPDAIRQDWAETFELYSEFRVDVEEYYEAGDEIVVFVRYRARGRASDVELDTAMANVWTFRDGTPIRMRQYLDRNAALHAVGLDDSAPTAYLPPR